MSDLELDALESEYHGCGWYAAWQEARQAFARDIGKRNFNVAVIGRRAWEELDAEQRSRTLDMLFTDYYIDVVEEERELQHQNDVANAKSYLEGFETQFLYGPLGEADVADEDAKVTVNAYCLRNVLAELELLQHRLKMRDQ